MEKIIALNHKMNMEHEQINQYINSLKKLDLNVVVFPTAIYAKSFINEGFQTGLQNIYHKENGAYTGEISPKQAKSIGVSHVIIGHSERRCIFGETNEDINKKIKQAQENNIKVILCIGEKQNEYYKEILKKQIEEGLKNITEEVIIAYEPVWAIGNKITPSNREIEEILKYIKSLFKYNVKVLYGGSVNSETIKTLKEVNEVAGYLIGGVSTDIKELEKIKRVIERE
ncbi:MAG: triosephosphate isomerase, partial [Bacilli bacterium]|nr:triosephosphate isomerase [Bacilli bacterium]